MRRQTQPASTNINMSTISSTASYRTEKSLSINEYELRRLPTQQRRVAKKTLMANVGYRLAKRKQLHIHR
jgi:hypothetical protein